MNRTIDIAQAALARHTLAAYPPDLLIEVPRSACRGLEFHRAAEVIEIGRELAAQALDTSTRRRSPDAEERGDGRRFPAALRAPGPRAGGPAVRIEWVRPECRQRLVVGEHPERRAGNPSISTAGPAPNGDGADSPAGTSTTAAAQSSARSRLIVLPMPPSM